MYSFRRILLSRQQLTPTAVTTTMKTSLLLFRSRIILFTFVVFDGVDIPFRAHTHV